MAGTPYILASALKDEFPQVTRAANIRRVSLDFQLKAGEEIFMPRLPMASSSDIFEIFTIPLVARFFG